MSIFIQEVLNLLQRDKSKQTLNLKTDYLEFGRKGTSTLNTGTSYAPSMDPYVIKAQDFVCSVTEGLTETVEGEGKEFVFPIYTKTDGLCELAALKNSVMLMVGDTVTVDDGSKFHSNWIRLGDVLEAGGSVGTVGQVLTVGSEGNPVWAAGGGGGGSITGGGTTNYMTMWTGSTSIGDSPMKMIQSISSGVNYLTLGADTDLDRVTFEATAEFQGGVRDRNAQLGTAGQVLKANVSGDVSWEDLAAPITYDLTGQVSGANDFAIGLAGSDGTLDKVSLIAGTDITLTDNGSNGVTIDCAGGTSSPVMTSILTGTGKLWSDVVQVQTAAAVSNTDLRTYGVQFNDAEQLVVNVPWVEGSGGTGTVTAVDFTSDIAAFTAATVDGTTTPSISLDLNGGTVGQFLRQDGLWATIPGGNPGTVTSVGLAMDGDAVSVSGTPLTSSGTLDISWIGDSNQYVNGEGNLVAFPTLTLGTVTDVSVLVNGGVTDAISLRVFDSTTTPRIELDFDGVADQYINGLGVLTTFPTITSGTVTTVSATTTGDALDVLVTNPTTAPALQFTWSGLATDYIDGLGNVKVFPASSAGTVTSVATTHSGNAFAATIGNVSTINPSVDITMQGDSSQYVNGSGDLATFPAIPSGTIESISTIWPSGADVAMTLTEVNLTGPGTQLNWDVQGTTAQYIDGTFKLQTFPAIPAVPFTSLTTTGTTGAATLTSGVLNIPEYTSAGTENCTFGYDILGDGKALTSTFVPIQSAGNVVLGYENTSGVRTNYLNTISLTFETKSTSKTYDFEIRFEARVPGAGIVPLHTYEDSFYSEGDKVITKTYTYYSPKVESNGEIFVSARTLGSGDLAIKTSHIAVVSSSCDAIVEGKVRDILF